MNEQTNNQTEAGTDVKVFKHAVQRRCLKLGAIALIIAAAINREDVLFGLIFGVCVGFINMNLMFFNLDRLKKDPGKARAQSFVSTIVRFIIIIGAGIAAYYKENFNLWVVLGGFLLTYVSIISIPVTERIKTRFLTHKLKTDA